MVALPSLGARQSPRGESEPPEPTLGAFGSGRALELAGLEEAVQEHPQPALDLARGCTGCGAPAGSGPARRRARGRPRPAARARRPCSADCRSAARGTGRSPAARRARRCARCSGGSVVAPASSPAAGISSGEIAVSTTAASTRPAAVAELIGVDRPAQQELDQRLGHGGVDVVVGHLVPDPVGAPAERQLAEIAGAEHQRVVEVGEPEQVRGALAGLDVLVGRCRRPARRSPRDARSTRASAATAGRMSSSLALTPSAAISSRALCSVRSLVPKPGIV